MTYGRGGGGAKMTYGIIGSAVEKTVTTLKVWSSVLCRGWRATPVASCCDSEHWQEKTHLTFCAHRMIRAGHPYGVALSQFCQPTKYNYSKWNEDTQCPVHCSLYIIIIRGKKLKPLMKTRYGRMYNMKTRRTTVLILLAYVNCLNMPVPISIALNKSSSLVDFDVRNGTPAEIQTIFFKF